MDENKIATKILITSFYSIKIHLDKLDHLRELLSMPQEGRDTPAPA
jgi:hypothetical protein